MSATPLLDIIGDGAVPARAPSKWEACRSMKRGQIISEALCLPMVMIEVGLSLCPELNAPICSRCRMGNFNPVSISVYGAVYGGMDNHAYSPQWRACTTPAGGASKPTFWTTLSVLPSASSPCRLLCTVRCVLGPCSMSSARPGFRLGSRAAALDLPIRYSITHALTLGLDIASSCLSIVFSLNRVVS